MHAGGVPTLWLKTKLLYFFWKASLKWILVPLIIYFEILGCSPNFGAPWSFYNKKIYQLDLAWIVIPHILTFWCPQMFKSSFGQSSSPMTTVRLFKAIHDIYNFMIMLSECELWYIYMHYISRRALDSLAVWRPLSDCSNPFMIYII